MLEKHLTAFVWLLLLLQALQPQVAQGRPVPLPGRKKSFGAGMLTGALAGVFVSKALAANPSQQQQQHHHYHGAVPLQAQAPPQPTSNTNHAPVVERGEQLPNGCYKQIVTEPDVLDPRKYVKSEQLICPAGVAMPAEAAASPVPSPLPVPQPVVPNVAQQSADAPAAESVPPLYPALPMATPTPTNTTIQASQSVTPENTVPAAVSTTNLKPAQPPATAATPAPTLGPVASPAQVPIPASIPGLAPTPAPAAAAASMPFFNQPAAPPQVVVLSKKTGFYGKSSATQNRNYIVMCLLATFVGLLF